MDYIDYALDQYYRRQEEAEKMAELGFTDTIDYANYQEDLKAYYQELQQVER